MTARRLEVWRRLLDPGSAALLEEAAGVAAGDVAGIARLRRLGDADLVAAALELVEARRRAARKFPDAARLVADVEGVEQATSHLVAEHKARRFAAALGGVALLDLCCGIGGDAMALARIGDVTAIDADPLRAWMAERNAGCRAEVADVGTIATRGAPFHLDPSRRGPEGERVWRYDDYEPSPVVIERLLASSDAGAVKLGPGIDLDALPDLARREVEIVNESGTLVQAVLWTGRLAFHPGRRTASRLPGGEHFTAAPVPLAAEPLGSFERYVVLLDPAIERAGLAGPLCAALPVRPVVPGLGILTARERVESPWLRAYEIAAELPWRLEKVKAWLDAHGAGRVDVKTRGGAVETDAAQRRLRGGGREHFVVFGLRLERRIAAIVARPPEAGGP